MLKDRNSIIAIVDSGIGGVSILKQIIKKFNSGNYIYYADNLYMPYGNKNKEWLKKRIKNIIDELINKYNVDCIIIACNTASACLETYNNSKVKLMKFSHDHIYFATNLTKQNLIDFNVLSDKTLAKQIENNILNTQKLNLIVKRHVYAHNLNKLKSFVLGCTHYELVKQLFEKFCPNSLVINNSSFIINSIPTPNNDDKFNVIILTSKRDNELEEKVRRLISN